MSIHRCLYYLSSASSVGHLAAAFKDTHTVAHLQPCGLTLLSATRAQLTRLLTSPMGAEVTGTIFVELNGRHYIFSNLQHPYEGSAWAPFANAIGAHS